MLRLMEAEDIERMIEERRECEPRIDDPWMRGELSCRFSRYRFEDISLSDWCDARAV
jgi:hypothetical protein